MSFRIVKDDNDQLTYLVNPRNYELIVSANLIVNTNTFVVVPDLSNEKAVKLAIFSYQPGVNVYAALNNTASSPAGSTFAVTNSDHLPPGWLVKSGDVLNFLTDNSDGAVVTIRFATLTGGFQ